MIDTVLPLAVESYSNSNSFYNILLPGALKSANYAPRKDDLLYKKVKTDQSNRENNAIKTKPSTTSSRINSKLKICLLNRESTTTHSPKSRWFVSRS